MELQDYLRILRAHVWVIVILTIAGGAAALGYSALQPTLYAATASGFVSTGFSDNLALANAGDTLAKSRARSYVDVAESRAVAQTVIEDLGLSQSPAALVTRISVSQPLDTVLITVTATDESPVFARDLADAWVAALSAQVEQLENPNAESGNNAIQLIPVEKAALPTTPVSPNTRLNVALGLLVGLALGVGYAVLRSQLDRRARTSEQIERELGLSVVGVIPIVPASKSSERVQISRGDADSGKAPPVAEAFRRLRTNLQFMDVDNPPRIIVVTSARAGEGKSTVTANLAVALAAGGQQVVVVDGDLRRPTVAETFGLVEGAGLTDVLIGRAEVEDVLQPWGAGGRLRILPAGAVPPNPSELLGSKAMRKLLTDLAEDAIVIIDTPPLLPVTDAAVLAASTDGAIVVTEAGRTRLDELARAVAHIADVQARTLGVVLNKVPKTSVDASYYGTYTPTEK